ncbi:MAG: diacylglycerol kinase family protein, partial [Actinobacteria bacterium]|nr:diacylglycerol kinase family protein [Actinomycetota bacterium]
MINKRALSFKNAFNGIVRSIKTQANFRIHLAISFIVLTAGIFLDISRSDFIVILTLIFVGLAIESVNTAIEETIDALHKDWSEEIKVAKDISASAMLI